MRREDDDCTRREGEQTGSGLPNNSAGAGPGILVGEKRMAHYVVALSEVDMDQSDKLTVTISGDQAERIRESIANGEFESAEDFVGAAIDSYDESSSRNLPDWLPDHDTLKRLVNEALDDPSPSFSSEEMKAEIDRWVSEADAEKRARINKAG
jgi:Arc/MetJ-type ribon-helix-helix transcriptional regulator